MTRHDQSFSYHHFLSKHDHGSLRRMSLRIFLRLLLLQIAQYSTASESCSIMKESVVLVMCGSFNPVTNMHLRMLEISRDHLQHCGYLVKGAFVSPVHDSYPKDTLISAKHRLTMLKLALESSDWIKLSTWETEQTGWTETFNVLQHHQDNLHELLKVKNINRNDKNGVDVNANVNHKVTVKLVCGGDFLASFLVPNLWKPEHIKLILKKFGIVVITRTGYNIANIIEDHDILHEYMTKIIVVNEFIENAISSTKIRKACSRNRSVKYLVPDKVERYIKNQSLYCTSQDKCKKAKTGFVESVYLVNEILNNSINKVTTGPLNNKLQSSSARRKRKSKNREEEWICILVTTTVALFVNYLKL